MVKTIRWWWWWVVAYAIMLMSTLCQAVSCKIWLLLRLEILQMQRSTDFLFDTLFPELCLVFLSSSVGLPLAMTYGS